VSRTRWKTLGRNGQKGS